MTTNKNNKDWVGNNKAVYTCLGASSHALEEREVNDYYATDPKAAEWLLELEPELDNIWECACGEGHISKVLQEYGYNVKSSDLIDRGFGEVQDFLTCTATFNGDILTNPPFKLADKFIRHSMTLLEKEGNKAIFLLKVQFLESKQRKSLFEEMPFKYLIVNSERQLCAKNGEFEKYTSTAQCYCWFIFEKGYEGLPQILWV